MDRDLAERRVVVTRAKAQAGSLAAALEARGAEPVYLPTIRVAPPQDPADLERAASSATDYDLLVLGSVNAAQALAGALEATGRRLTAPVACVGKKTAAALERQATLRAWIAGDIWIPSVYRAEMVVERVQEGFRSAGGLAGRRVLFPRAPEGRETIIDGLEARGAQVDAVEAYRIVPAAPPSAAERAALDGVDAYTFLSGETLACGLDVLGEAEARRRLAACTVAVIGPVAKQRADALGIRVDVVPPEATVEALVEALARILGR